MLRDLYCRGYTRYFDVVDEDWAAPEWSGRTLREDGTPRGGIVWQEVLTRYGPHLTEEELQIVWAQFGGR